MSGKELLYDLGVFPCDLLGSALCKPRVPWLGTPTGPTGGSVWHGPTGTCHCSYTLAMVWEGRGHTARGSHRPVGELALGYSVNAVHVPSQTQGCTARSRGAAQRASMTQGASQGMAR